MIINALCRSHAVLFGRRGPFVPPKGDSAAANSAAGAPIGAPRGDSWPTVFAATPRKTAALLESAKRFVTAVELYQTEGKDKFLQGTRDERKKLFKFAYTLIASGSSVDDVRPAFVAAGLLGKSALEDECEAEMVVAGTRLALRSIHPIIIMRAMTAYLGFPAFESAEKWMLEHFVAAGSADEELIIPGDLPEVLSERDISAGSIGQAVRLAGRQLVAATLAGCPRETIDSVKALAYTPLGGILLDGDIASARSRLSSEELADAQNAFMELLASFHGETAEPASAGQEAWQENIDEDLVSDVSGLVLELDEHVLKSVIASLDPKLVASLIQTMEPIAHDRLFSTIPAGRSKRILDALEMTVPLPAVELTRRAQIFAQKVLSEIAPKTKTLGRSLPLPARLRQLLTSILSRE